MWRVDEPTARTFAAGKQIETETQALLPPTGSFTCGYTASRARPALDAALGPEMGAEPYGTIPSASTDPEANSIRG